MGLPRVTKDIPYTFVELAGEIQGPVADVPEQVPYRAVVWCCIVRLLTKNLNSTQQDSGFFGQLIC